MIRSKFLSKLNILTFNLVHFVCVAAVFFDYAGDIC